jgi:hypothetical protein
LPLGWTRYLDSVEDGSEVWVYFKGARGFQPAVYAKGKVHKVDLAARQVLLGDLEYSQTPLTDPATTRTVAGVVAPPGRQVFLLPEEFEPVADCSLSTGGSASCRERRCRWCKTWQELPRIKTSELTRPDRLTVDVDGFVPAYWVIAPRSDPWYEGWRVRPGIKRTTELFYRFKQGDGALAYPLALGIYESLSSAALTQFDAIVPIPLSPDKEEAGEIHRTLRLSEELSSLLDVDVADIFELDKPISKRKLQVSPASFEKAYWASIYADEIVSELSRVLLVDDTCTNGSTLNVAIQEIRRLAPECSVVAAAAAQMTVKSAIRDPAKLYVR